MPIVTAGEDPRQRGAHHLLASTARINRAVVGERAPLSASAERGVTSLPHFEEDKGYKTNRYPNLSAETRDEIARRWAVVIERYGYAAPPG